MMMTEATWGRQAEGSTLNKLEVGYHRAAHFTVVIVGPHPDGERSNITRLTIDDAQWLYEAIGAALELDSKHDAAAGRAGGAT